LTLDSSQPARIGNEARIGRLLITLLLAVFFAGFAKNFYLRAWFGTRPLIFTAWVHGLVMTAWLVLFAAQIILVTRGRLALHRRIGRWGAWLAAVVVVVGIVTILVRSRLMYPAATPSMSAVVFVAFDGLSLLLFGALVGLAWRHRARPALHRPLMTMATVALLPPAFGRLVAYMRHDHIEVAVVGLMGLTVLIFVTADFLRSHRVAPAAWLAGVAILLVNGITYVAQLALD
jgi:hypothetical protein